MSARTGIGHNEPLLAGRYRLRDLIGQGGMGRVWRAVDEILDRDVAIKEMRGDGDAEHEQVQFERFRREARSSARIDHPHVVRVYDVVEEGGRLWIVMELVAGRSLDVVLVDSGPLSLRRTARIGLQLATALRAVHAAGILHRDIKPGNVLLAEEEPERVVLTDFGIAALQDSSSLTSAGMLVGSPEYMAPERVSGGLTGPPSDLWSLGATLYAALSGHSPFERSTTLATLHAVLYEEPGPMNAAGALLPLLVDLLHKDPGLRPAPDEVLRRLTEISENSDDSGMPASVSRASADPAAQGSPGPEHGAESRLEPHAVRTVPNATAPTSTSVTAPAPPAPPPPAAKDGRQKRWWHLWARGQRRQEVSRAGGPTNGSGAGDREPPMPHGPAPSAPEPDPALPRSYIPRKPVTAFARHSFGPLAHLDDPDHETGVRPDNLAP